MENTNEKTNPQGGDLSQLRKEFNDYQNRQNQRRRKTSEEILAKYFVPRKNKEIFRIVPPKQGKKYIHSKNLYNKSELLNTSAALLSDRLSLLKRSGYLVRSSFDPARSYNPGLKQKQFINVSLKGVRLLLKTQELYTRP